MGKMDPKRAEDCSLGRGLGLAPTDREMLAGVDGKTYADTANSGEGGVKDVAWAPDGTVTYLPGSHNFTIANLTAKELLVAPDNTAATKGPRSDLVRRVGDALARKCLDVFGATWSNDVRWALAEVAIGCFDESSIVTECLLHRTRVQELTNALTAARSALEASKQENAHLQAVNHGHSAENDRLRATVAILSERPSREARAALEALTAARSELEASKQENDRMRTTIATLSERPSKEAYAALEAENTRLQMLAAARRVMREDREVLSALDDEMAEYTYEVFTENACNAHGYSNPPDAVHRAIIPGRLEHEARLCAFLRPLDVRIIAVKDCGDGNAEFLIEGDSLDGVSPDDVPVHPWPEEAMALTDSWAKAIEAKQEN